MYTYMYVYVICHVLNYIFLKTYQHTSVLHARTTYDLPHVYHRLPPPISSEQVFY